MGKVNIGKLSGFVHSFEIEGERFELTLNTGLTNRQLDEKIAELKPKYPDTTDQEQQVKNSLAFQIELCLLFILAWNLEDDAGDIPLTFQALYDRVPSQLISRLSEEAQDALRQGGLKKKT